MHISKLEQIETSYIEDGIAHIDISTDNHPDTWMICDEDDYVKWKDSDCGRIFAFENHGEILYALCRRNNKVIRFHRFVNSKFKIIDHIDKNGLNNKKSNLRNGNECNAWNTKHQVNNTTGFKGVSFDKDVDKYKACIRLNSKQRTLGRFNTPEEASERYKLAEQRRWQGLSLEEL